MQPQLRRFSIVAGFVLLAGLLIGDALVTRSALNAQIDTGHWVMHSRQVRLEILQLETLLMDAETGQRGFLLTGEDRYLAPYEQARAEIGGHIDTLAKLTTDNPIQQKRIAELRPLVREAMDQLDRTIILFRAGHADDANAIIRSSQGLMVMGNLRGVLDQMRQEEMDLDITRSAAYRRSVMITGISNWVVTFAALVGLIVLGVYILREMRFREDHAREMRDREEWFRVTLSSIGDAVIATDRSGKVAFLNPVAEAMTGHKLSDAQGKGIAEVFPICNEMTGLPAEDPVKRVVEAGAVVGLANHTILKPGDGRTIPIEDSAAPIRDDRGDLIGVVLVFRDVTAERKSEEVLRKAEKLAAAARLSATMAHEINNPLAAVMNLLFLAQSEPDTPPSVSLQLTQAEQELQRVAHITRQTLGFYRESGTNERVDIAAIVESVLKLYGNKLEAKNIAVKRSFDGCPPAEGVVGELRQAVSNLIANAIDAVEEGGAIAVGVHTAPGDDGGMLEITVVDDGPGIAEDHLDRIFEPFFTTKKDVGTGLGLWAAKSIVERHGGRICACPQNQGDGAHGATFTIQLPCAASEKPAEVK
ncbi:MAG: CHASE3 domain-containing protein [Terracidiphilus sp.]|jgi:PAS domain S-box-containing protein